MRASTCVLSYVCSHMCDMCPFICVILHVRFNLCAFTCVLSYVGSRICASTCVFSHVLLHSCAFKLFALLDL